MSTFGYTDPGAGNTWFTWEDRRYAAKATLAETGRVSTITVRLDGLSTNANEDLEQAVRFGIYEDNAGSPGDLIAETEQSVVAAGALAHWLTLSFPTEPTLTADDYWIVIHTGPGDIIRYVWTSVVGSMLWDDDTFSDGLDTAFGAGQTGEGRANHQLVAFGTYSAISGAYDPAIHHVGLGPSGSPQSGYLLDGPHRQDLQRFSTPSEFGSADDVLGGVPALARWTQDDFLGGQYGYIWGEDNKQFARCSHFLPSQLGKTLRTVPPLSPWLESIGVPATWGADEIKLVASYGPNLILVLGKDTAAATSGGKIIIYAIEDGTLVHSGTISANYNIQAAAIDYTSGNFFYLRDPNTGNADTQKVLWRVDPLTGSGLTSINVASPPNTHFCNGFIVDAGTIYSSWANQQQLYTGALSDDYTSITWTKIGFLDGRWKDALTYNGLVYILLADESGRAKVVTFDGTDILPVTDLPFNFTGRCLASYGGRIYVGGAGKDIAGNDTYAELYEISGSSLRLVRTFAPESRVSSIEQPTTINEMQVHEGLLFLACDGPDEIIVYDVVNDSFFGGPGFALESGGPTITNVLALASTRERLVAFVEQSDGTFDYFRLGDDLPVAIPTFNCEIETSDFQPEPAMDKRLAKVSALTRYDSLNSIEVSTDGGSSWMPLSMVVTQEGDFYRNTADLANIDPSGRARLRFTFQRSSVTEFAEFVAFTLQFVFLDAEKFAWSLTVAAVETVEDEAGASLEQEINAVVAELRSYAMSRQRLTFTDVDGASYDVIVRDFSVHRPLVGPQEADGSREALVNLTLVEV